MYNLQLFRAKVNTLKVYFWEIKNKTDECKN